MNRFAGRRENEERKQRRTEGTHGGSCFTQTKKLRVTIKWKWATEVLCANQLFVAVKVKILSKKKIKKNYRIPVDFVLLLTKELLKLVKNN